MEAAVVVLAIVIARRPAAVPGRLLPAVAAVGILDMLGNAGFLFAEATGSLAVASILTSLYPVVTVLLALVVLREPVSWSHALGIGLALVAIVLIAAGSTT